MINSQSNDPVSEPEAQRHAGGATHDRRRTALRKQILRRRGGGFATLLNHLFDALLDERSGHLYDARDWQRVKATLRFASRIAEKYPHQCTVTAVITALRTTNPGEALVSVLDTAKRQRAERQTAAVRTKTMLPELRRFLRLLNHHNRFRIPPIELAEAMISSEQLGETITAFTDSKRLVMPSIIATTSSRVINQRYAYYVVIHEFAHCRFNSFLFSTQTRRGKVVLRAFERLNHVSQVTDQRKKFEEAIFALGQAELGIDISQIEESALDRFLLNGMSALFARTQYPDLSHYLFNALEDGRIEREIKHHWPGLSMIHEMHENRSQGLYSAAEFASSIQNLLVATASCAAGRRFPAIVAQDHQTVLSKCIEVIDRFARLGRRRDVYHTLLYVVELLECLSPALDRHQSEAKEAARALAPPMPMLGIEVARLRKYLEENTTERRHFNLPLDDGEREPTDHGYLVDELVDDGGNFMLEPEVTQVVFSPYESLVPNKLPTLAPLTLPFPALQSDSVRRLGKRHFHADGQFMASDRLAAYVASTNAGGDDFPLMYDIHEHRSRLHFTIVCDLSLSMEARLAALGDDSPLQRAIQLIKWLAGNFRRQGIKFDVVGAHDSGRRPVHLRRLQLQTDDSIETLRAVGFGGFRLGALLRGLHRRQIEQPIGTHAVIAVTDALGLYLQPSADATVDRLQALCSSCHSKPNCSYERDTAKRSPNSFLYEQLHFSSDELAWTDVADAIESTQTRHFHLFAIDDDLQTRNAVLNHHLGHQWSDATTPAGILKGVRRIADFPRR